MKKYEIRDGAGYLIAAVSVRASKEYALKIVKKMASTLDDSYIIVEV